MTEYQTILVNYMGFIIWDLLLLPSILGLCTGHAVLHSVTRQ